MSEDQLLNQVIEYAMRHQHDWIPYVSPLGVDYTQVHAQTVVRQLNAYFVENGMTELAADSIGQIPHVRFSPRSLPSGSKCEEQLS